MAEQEKDDATKAQSSEKTAAPAAAKKATPAKPAAKTTAAKKTASARKTTAAKKTTPSKPKGATPTTEEASWEPVVQGNGHAHQIPPSEDFEHTAFNPGNYQNVP